MAYNKLSSKNKAKLLHLPKWKNDRKMTMKMTENNQMSENEYLNFWITVLSLIYLFHFPNKG